MRKRILLGCVVAALVAAGTVVWMEGSRSVGAPVVVAPSIPSAKAKPPAALARMEAETKRRTTLAMERIALPQPDHVREHEAAVSQAAEQLTTAFGALYEQRDYFDKDTIYEEVLGQLLEDPENVEAASRALTDPAFLKDAFGAQQALGRVYAIKLLKLQAERGDPSALMSTTRELFASVARHGEQIKGQYRDVESLLRALLGMGYDREELIGRGAEVVRELLFDEGQATADLGDDGLIDAVEGAFFTATFGHPAKERVQQMAESVDRVLKSRG